MELTFQVSGVQGASGLLREVADLLRSTKPMQGMVDDTVKKIKEKTAAGRNYRNQPFKKYSKSTEKRKGSSLVNLHVSGTMMGALTGEVVNAHHGKVDLATTAEPGGRVNAAMLGAYHNQGTSKTPKHAGLPKREFMNLTVKDLDDMKKKHYDDEVLKIVRKASLRGEYQTD